MSGVSGPGPLEFPGTPRFEIVRRLGAGGMGVVYEALDREQQCRVALKTVQTLQAEALLRLKNEFRALQDLDHPNLVNLGELCEVEGRWFFTMELVHGVNFTQYVRGAAPFPEPSSAGGDRADVSPDAKTHQAVSPDANTVASASSVDGAVASSPPGDRPSGPRPVTFDEPRLRAALAQLAAGLRALHDMGRVHRDIKPSNILVTPAGRVVILDFGLATGIDRTDQSSALHPVGTFEYMAPEQAASKPVGPEADWYSVGVLLYQALAGQVPFAGAPLEVMMSKQQHDPAPPRTICAAVPPDLDALCVDLLRFDPRQRPTGAEVLRRIGATAAPTPAGPSSASFTQTPPFVGRAEELGSLRAAFEASRHGTAVAVLVQGESGIGKSALVRRFAEEIRGAWADAVVLTGRCYEREAVPFKGVDGVIDALSRYMTRLPDDRAAALLPRAAGLLGRVFPVLRRVKALAESPLPGGLTGADPQEQRTRLFAAVRELLGRLADRGPLVLIIDDLHWVDADSLALLAELLRPPEAPAMLLVATLRRASELPARTNAVDVVATLPGDVRRLSLGRLPADDASELVTQLLRRAAGQVTSQASVIAAEARGHPLFIDELVRYAALRPGPASASLTFEQVVRARVASLPAAARKVLEVVAVAGPPLAQDVVARAAGLEPAEFARAVAVLRVGNLVQTTGVRGLDAVATYHDRVRGAILAQLEVEERRSCHRELALALEATGHADARTLADQWRGAGDPDRAAAYVIRAAADAEVGLAFAQAADLYRVALELRPGDSSARKVRVKLAYALQDAGRGAEAAATFVAAAAEAPAPEALELKRRAAENYLRSGHVDEGLATVSEVLRVIGLRLPQTPRRALVSAFLRRALIRLRGLRFRERHASQVPPEQLERIDICWAVASTLGMVNNMYGVDFNGRTLLMALRAGEPGRLALALANETIYTSLEGHGARSRALRLLELTERLAHRLDDPRCLAWATSARGIADYFSGRFAAAREHLAQAEQLHRERCTGATFEVDTMSIFTLLATFYVGRIAELSRRTPQLLAEALDRGDLYLATNLRLGLANCAWLVGDSPDEAQRMADEASARWSHAGFQVQHWYDLTAQVQIALYRGEGARAREVLAGRWAGLNGSLLLRIEVVRIEALVLRARAALAAAATSSANSELLREAERDALTLAGQPAAWGKALAEALLAGVAARRGAADEARDRLREAEEAFAAAHMALHAALARRRRGQLVGGDQGRTLVAAADAWLADQRIARPDRWAAMLAPGFDD
jgi:serine/threonine protein kinase/tetratricopeptide (TPR) repeat protein